MTSASSLLKLGKPTSSQTLETKSNAGPTKGRYSTRRLIIADTVLIPISTSSSDTMKRFAASKAPEATVKTPVITAPAVFRACPAVLALNLVINSLICVAVFVFFIAVFRLLKIPEMKSLIFLTNSEGFTSFRSCLRGPQFANLSRASVSISRRFVRDSQTLLPLVLVHFAVVRSAAFFVFVAKNPAPF